MPEKHHELLYFFYRPTKPVFTPKGLRQNVYFKVPDSLFPEEYRNVAEDYKEELERKKAAAAKTTATQTKLAQVSSHINQPSGFDEEPEEINIEDIPVNVDLDLVTKVEKSENFMIFDPFHTECASVIIKAFTECPAKDLRNVYAKLHLQGVNPQLLTYAFSVALIHRSETDHLGLPSPVTHSPEYFVDRSAIREALTEGSVVANDVKRKYIKLKATASDLEIENRVAYFREDIGVNMHHWHWHLVYPYKAEGPLAEKIVKKDRRGELFYYMHQQIVARYNFERFCNKLHRTVSLSNFYEQIPQGYFPKLESPFTKTRWASRDATSQLRDITMRTRTVKILELELWRDRILNAIHSGLILHDGKLEPIDPNTGIDDIGNLVEASSLSKNAQYYGNLHNFGHLMISYMHDPDNRYLEGVGCMGDNRTAMRDPLFYRWHAFVDDLFDEYKKTLPPYTVEQLKLDDVEIQEVNVITHKNDDLGITEDAKNKFYTYTQTDLVNLAYGLDIKDKGSVYVEFPHIQHQNFEYNIKVKNTGEERNVTVRIFLAPSRDEVNKKYDSTNPTFPLTDQRRFFVELDKFTAKLAKDDVTTINQSSVNSSVTIPFKQMFADVGDIMNELAKTNPEDKKDTSQIAYCGCGWPHHMLIPKGTYSGFPGHLFVMLTDAEADKAEEDTASDEKSGTESKDDDKCPKTKNAVSYCGVKNKKYPDKKAMGFPFDRPPRLGVKSVQDFCQYKKSATDTEFSYITNMKFVDVLVHHIDKTLPGQSVGDITQYIQAHSAIQKETKPNA